MTGVCTHVAVWNIAVVCLCASVTFTYGDVRFGVSQKQADYNWIQANEKCDLPGTEELCDEGVCDAGKLKSLLDPNVQGQNITTWVRIYYNIHQNANTWLTEGCYVYDIDYENIRGKEIGRNSAESCANKCGFGIQTIYLLRAYCYCSYEQLSSQRPTKTFQKKNTTESCSALCKGSSSYKCGGPIRTNQNFNYPVYITEYLVNIPDQRNPELRRDSTYCVSLSTTTNRFTLERDCNRKLKCLVKMNRTEAGETDKATTKPLLTTLAGTTEGSGPSTALYVGAGLAFLVVICIIVIIILLRKKKKQKSKLPEVQTVYTAHANEEEQVNLLPVPNTDTSPDDSERPEYSYSDTTVTRTEVEGQYDQLDRTGQRPRQSVVSKDSTYDHADPTSQEVTYSETHRNRKSQTIDGDDVYDHADKNVHDDSNEVLNNDDTDYEQSIVNEVKDDTNKERSENGVIN